MPIPVSLTTSSTASPSVRRRKPISPAWVNFKAFESRLRTIISHIERSTKASSRRSMSTTKRRPALSTAERKRPPRSCVTRREIGLDERRVVAAGFEARELEQRVDELQQPQRVAVRGLEQRRIVGSGPAQQFGDGSEHQRQRRAEFVADVGEELDLRAVEFGERLGAFALVLIGARARDRGRDLPGDQLEKAAVPVVERLARVDARDQEPGRLVGDAREDRHGDRFARRTRATVRAAPARGAVRGAGCAPTRRCATLRAAAMDRRRRGSSRPPPGSRRPRSRSSRKPLPGAPCSASRSRDRSVRTERCARSGRASPRPSGTLLQRFWPRCRALPSRAAATRGVRR